VSLNGKLEDVSLADVMQFVHLGRRTGTLSLSRGSQEAEIGFHRGQIVSAWSPGSRRLGDLLIAKNLVDPLAMAEMLRIQTAEQPRRSLGQVLIASGVLEFDQIREVIEEQIEHSIYELVTWTSGSFEFALDELKPIDDIAMYPGDLIPKLDLNTQMVLLEATRIMDEKQRGGEGDRESPERPQAGPTEAQPDGAGEDDGQRMLGESRSLSTVSETIESFDLEIPLEEGESNELPEAHRRLQIVSPDRQLASQMAEIIRTEIAHVVRVPLREAGTRLPGEPTPTIVVLDMRLDSHTEEDLLAIRRSRPRSSIICLIDSQEMTTRAFEAGAVAAISANPNALAACFYSLVRTLQDFNGTGGGTSSASTRAGFARLRRVLADIRSGLLSATMALNLMHIISESVERAVLFLVRRDSLTALGAFGFSSEGRPLAEVTRSLRLSLGADNVLTRCVADGQPRSLSFDQASLPPEFFELVGRPRNGQLVVFPVLGAERVISVVYTDNGSSNRAIEDIELLELATAQVGVAFENELLRRKIDSH